MTGHHSPLLVVLSVIVAALASYTALSLTGRVAAARGGARAAWLFGGAWAMGTGIWSMHFLGMLAFRLPVPIGYASFELISSYFIAIFASLLALFVASRRSVQWYSIAGGAVLLGAAISGMHYMGMAAVRVPAELTYHAGWVTASIVIAVVASVAALLIALSFRTDSKGRELRKLAAGVAMGLAIAGMHYTAMYAAHFGEPEATSAISGALILDTTSMAWAVLVTSLIVLPFAIVSARIDRHMSNARVQAAEALRNREERFRALIENAEDGILIMSELGATIYMSPALERMIGNDPGKDPGSELKSALALIHPDDRGTAVQALATVLKSPQQKTHCDIRMKEESGSWRMLSATLQNLLDNEAVQGIVVNTRDITEHRHVEEQLRQAQKMEAVGRLAGGVAHDFNNLLTVITGYSELALIELNDTDAAEHVHAIRNAADRASSLTRQLLAFSRLQVLHPRVLSLNRVIDGVTKLLRPILGEDIEIVTQLKDDLWSTKADPTQIESVIMNLAVNARDAMPKGGLLTIQTRNRTLTEHDERDLLYEFDPGEYVMLTVEDTGSGIDEATRQRIFEPFFTTKESGRGTGLGLSTVYGIVKQSGGFISVDSEISVGTRFSIYLPRAAQAEHVEEAVIEETIPDRTGRIMIVEDEVMVRSLIETVLAGKGFEIVTAGNGAEALARLESFEVDLIITDMVMPGMTGQELAARALQIHPEVKILYMSGYSASAIQSDGVLDEGTLFLEKPFKTRILLEHVAQLLGQRASAMV
jgi:PAS domain S-box-containing protein